MSKEKSNIGPKPDLKKGDIVLVTEEGITPWRGIVNSVKPSKESGWWVDVQMDRGGIMSICTTNGTVIERVA